MNISLPILNREFKRPGDDFYHLVPMGEFRGLREREGEEAVEIVQVIDRAAVESMVMLFNRQAQEPNFPGVLVDFEHFSYDLGKESEAAGWITELQGRDNGLWGKVRWSDKGEAAVMNGRYRLVSPVWLQMQELGGKRARPLKLDTVGLTNKPNMRGMVPLSNRANGDDVEVVPTKEFRRGAGARSAGIEATNKPKDKRMKSVATRLGLSADASEEAVLTEVTKIMNRASEAELKIVPLSTRVTELETANAALVGEQIDADLAGRGVTDEKVLNRLKPVLGKMANRAERIAFLEDTGFKVVTAAKEETGKVLNRAGAKTPDQAQAGSDVERAGKIRNRASELQKSGMSFDSAFAQASQEVK